MTDFDISTNLEDLIKFVDELESSPSSEASKTEDLKRVISVMNNRYSLEGFVSDLRRKDEVDLMERTASFRNFSEMLHSVRDRLVELNSMPISGVQVKLGAYYDNPKEEFELKVARDIKELLEQSPKSELETLVITVSSGKSNVLLRMERSFNQDWKTIIGG